MREPRLGLLFMHFNFRFNFGSQLAGMKPSPPDVLLLLSARLCAQLRGEAAFVTPALRATVSQ